ncbi:MAG: hypothetical protein H6584_04905 [Flavobacteriales bacterium]|nr:hypothetical protein [Flavobacteriales bacterium]
MFLIVWDDALFTFLFQHSIIPALLVIIGGIIFRFVMVEAGQLTRYLY